jgi:hypothetical protein
MIRDPFYRDIITALGERLDPELFERCAADLLRSIYPGLVPIRGGADAGMDGAIADGEGPAYPLVSTTSKRGLDNLRRSLQSYLAEGGERRAVVFATSRALSPKQRRNLGRAAAELGFTLLQIHEQAAFADLLYHSPEWCRELLNLTGQPPALSALPLTTRPCLGDTVVGRGADLNWLSGGEGDALLVGQPGSGKTFIMRELVARGEGLFVVSDDPGRIAEALRAQSPGAVFVDDAHLQRDLLIRLVQLRGEIGADFRIVATCWPGEAVEVMRGLGISRSGVRELELLTRREIAEVIRACGIHGPRPLLRELIDQTKGRPGLAVTLCSLCLREGVRDVVTAASLYEDVRVSFGQLVGARAVPILAGFAVGGGAGMRMEVVAAALGLPLVELHEAVVRLAAGGVLNEKHDRSLSVQPDALGHALVGDVFFGGAGSLPVHAFLAAAPDPDAAAMTLVGARSRGAAVPDTLIRDLLVGHCTSRAWRAYGSLGPEEVRWVLDRRPDLLLEIAWSGLEYLPEITIPRMLARAVGDGRALHSHPEHPLRILQDWVKSATPGEGEVVDRRAALLDATLAWHTGGAADPAVCLRALAAAFTPEFEDHESDPVDGTTFTMRFGGLLLDEVEGVQALWPRAIPLLTACGFVDSSTIQYLIRDWAHPEVSTRGYAAPEVRASMVRFARRMTEDVLAAAGTHPGFRLWAARLAERMGWEVHVDVDAAFEVLYPNREPRDLRAAHREQMAAATALAEAWAQEQPTTVAERLVRYADAAASAGLRWPDWTEHVCRRIAETVQDPVLWARTLVTAGGSYLMVGPFLQRVLGEALPGWEELWGECYDSPGLRGSAILIALTEPRTPERVLDRALRDLTGLDSAIQTECLRRHIPEDRLARLLRHPSGEIAAAAVEGIWHADPEGVVPEVLREDFRRAAVEHLEHDHTLGLVFKADPSLAFEWLRIRIGKSPANYWRDDEPFAAAVSVLDRDQRRQLLQHVTVDTWPREIVRYVVDRDPELFSVLLSSPDLARLHLEPLGGEPDAEWIPLALMALDAGYEAEEVAGAVRGSMWQWDGKESDMWAGWVDRFRPLESHPHPGIRRIGTAGREHAESELDRALRREREEAVHGRRT